MKVFKSFIFMSVLTLTLAACSNSSLERDCPDAEISWTNTLMFNDIRYENDSIELSNKSSSMIAKGKELGEVTYRMADNACTDHQIQNGEATYLAEGTIIYEVDGYPTSLLVLANDEVFVANANTMAKTVAHLYPMDNLVKNIHIQSNEDGKRLHTFSQSSTDKFLAQFITLKLDDEANLEGDLLFLEIELDNGVSFREVYSLDSYMFGSNAIGNHKIHAVIQEELSNLKR